jgi:hypothetical protein
MQIIYKIPIQSISQSDYLQNTNIKYQSVRLFTKYQYKVSVSQIIYTIPIQSISPSDYLQNPNLKYQMLYWYFVNNLTDRYFILVSCK